jgi:hypothetical protein
MHSTTNKPVYTWGMQQSNIASNRSKATAYARRRHDKVVSLVYYNDGTSWIQQSITRNGIVENMLLALYEVPFSKIMEYAIATYPTAQVRKSDIGNTVLIDL